MQIKTRIASLLIALIAMSETAAAQVLYTDAITKDEFIQRRARVAERIGDGVAIIEGAAELAGYSKFRQNNQFFYLTGVEVPRAIVLIDGRAKTTTLYLPPRNERAERSEGAVLIPGDSTVKVTGVTTAEPREAFAGTLMRLAMEGRPVYTPFRPEALATGAPEYSIGNAAQMAADPWDGRQSREGAFIQKLRAAAPQIDLRNLDPVVDEMRMIKSPREIQLIREATRLGGLAMMEAMRSARPGMFEYEIEAIGDYIFKKHNAQGPAYFAITASGKNSAWPHYHQNQAQLRDGDLVLFDYSPDFKYYTADVTREFPASGKFTPDQRELYGVYVALYRAIMESIRPAPVSDIVKDAIRKMDGVLTSYRFANQKNRDAAVRFVDSYKNRQVRTLGHMVGMEVHDVVVPYTELKPGMVFTIEPALTIPEDRVYVRLEDMILVTDKGYENLSGFVPMDIEGIEKLMTEEGFDHRYSRPTS